MVSGIPLALTLWLYPSDFCHSLSKIGKSNCNDRKTLAQASEQKRGSRKSPLRVGVGCGLVVVVWGVGGKFLFATLGPWSNISELLLIL